MGSSSRASRIKKNNQALKKRVFGPVEARRNERLNAKLLELAKQAKPPRPEMEVEQGKDADGEVKEDEVTGDGIMDVDDTTAAKLRSRSDTGDKEKKNKWSKIQKSRHRRARNDIVFQKTGHAKSKAAKKGRKR